MALHEVFVDIWQSNRVIYDHARRRIHEFALRREGEKALRMAFRGCDDGE